MEWNEFFEVYYNLISIYSTSFESLLGINGIFNPLIKWSWIMLSSLCLRNGN